MSEIYVFANIIDLKTPESCQVKADTDSEPRQTSKTFYKKLHIQCLTGF